jgi:hypothetical protein
MRLPLSFVIKIWGPDTERNKTIITFSGLVPDQLHLNILFCIFICIYALQIEAEPRSLFNFGNSRPHIPSLHPKSFGDASHGVRRRHRTRIRNLRTCRGPFLVRVHSVQKLKVSHASHGVRLGTGSVFGLPLSLINCSLLHVQISNTQTDTVQSSLDIVASFNF